MELALQRRFFAEEIEAAANLKTAGLVDALATVPREKFLPPGPWMLKSEADVAGPPRLTPDADPRRVNHNLAVGIDPARMLFNGAPGLVSMLIDTLRLKPGDRVAHIGCGLGYYTALIAAIVGPNGRVVAIEVDDALAVGARANLAPTPWVEVVRGEASGALGESFDAILVNAGVTHPLDTWLDALTPGGRLLLPITFSMPAMGPIGKGTVVLLTRQGDTASFDARAVTFVAIYSAQNLRNESLNEAIGCALQANPFPRLKRLRRDVHEAVAECWLHGDAFCLSL
jgi:protein-L-isoaspartate(D-aspartate) O-methyltransferase